MSYKFIYGIKFRASRVNLAEKARDFFLKKTNDVGYTNVTRKYINREWQMIDTGINEFIVVDARFDNVEEGRLAKQQYLSMKGPLI